MKTRMTLWSSGGLAGLMLLLEGGEVTRHGSFLSPSRASWSRTLLHSGEWVVSLKGGAGVAVSPGTQNRVEAGAGEPGNPW